MKKSVLALAVAAALAAPLAAQADTILYGSARVSVDYNDEDFIDNDFNGEGNWDVVNNASRLGVQGSEDLGGGLSAIYQYEFGVDMTEGSNFQSNRPKFVGLKGNFGTLTLGTQETPYYLVAGVTDTFNTDKSFGPTAYLGGSFNGYNLNPESNRGGGGALFRLEDSVIYTTPEFSGFSASVLLSMSNKLVGTAARNNVEFPIFATERDGWSDGVDIWNINVKYTNGPFFAGASYIALDGSSDQYVNVDLDLDQWVIGLGYSSGPFEVGLIYEQGTYNEWGLFEPTFRRLGFETDTPWNAYLTASYAFGNNIIRGAYGQLVNGLSDQDTIQNYLVGYQYNFSKRTRLWVEYIGRSTDTIFYGDQNAVSIGTRVDF